MKKCIFGDKLDTNIDLYALILTLLFLGVFLHFDYICIISKTITVIIECICLCLSSILLMNEGCKLKKRGILGVKEMAFGAIQLYIMAACLSTTNTMSIVWFFSVGFYLFNFIGGFLAFIYTLIEKWSSNTSNLLSKTESVVVIITSIFVAVFAGIQLFV